MKLWKLAVLLVGQAHAWLSAGLTCSSMASMRGCSSAGGKCHVTRLASYERNPKPLACPAPLRAAADDQSGSHGDEEENEDPGSFKVSKSRYESFYEGQGDGGKLGAIDTTAVDDASALLAKPTNPFFVGYEDDELQHLWQVHTHVYGARKDPPGPTPGASNFLPVPNNDILPLQVRKELEAGAQERIVQLSGTSAKGETKNDLSAANDSESGAGQAQERKGGETGGRGGEGAARRKRKGSWGNS